MPSFAFLARVILGTLLAILHAQSTPQTATPAAEATRVHLKENAISCYILNSVQPIYPRAARLAGIQGAVKLELVVADDGFVADVQAISGDPLLLDSAMKAVRKWRFQPVLLNGGPAVAVVPLSFTFTIEALKPAYLHLTNGKVIRADEVQEFTDRIEYTVGHLAHHISAESVADISACARVSIHLSREGDCAPSGGPSFSVRAIPLLPAAKTHHIASQALR